MVSPRWDVVLIAQSDESYEAHEPYEAHELYKAHLWLLVLYS